MIHKRVLHLAQLSVVGLAGYYIGQKEKIFENNENIVLQNGKTLKSMPGLPIFGTVSAAVPYTDGGHVKDRVCFIHLFMFIKKIDVTLFLYTSNKC